MIHERIMALIVGSGNEGIGLDELAASLDETRHKVAAASWDLIDQKRAELTPNRKLMARRLENE